MQLNSIFNNRNSINNREIVKEVNYTRFEKWVGKIDNSSIFA